MSDWLNGKKTIISGAIVMVMNLLVAFKVVEVPTDIAAAIDSLLGALVIIFRIKATKTL